MMRSPLIGEPPDAELLRHFDAEHPLLGGLPVSILVDNHAFRRVSKRFDYRSSTGNLPPGSFFRLREGLVMMTPECAFARLGNTLNVYQLIQAGTDLCAQYYVDGHTGDIERRKAYLTSPERLSNYLEHAGMIKGSKKAVHALRFVLPNSGSPRETLMNIQFNIPLRMGSFALGLNAMNYDINAGRLATLFDQNSYSIDIAQTDKHIGIEYDGEDYHTDPWKDTRSRNELGVLGWSIYPIRRDVLNDPNKTIQFGLQMRKALRLRNRMPERWDGNFELLRKSIGLPV